MNSVTLHGFCDPAFTHVRDVFAENFSERGEIGAAVCVYKDGKSVVDLWGGLAVPKSNKQWEKDTIVCMLSVGKAMAALCVLRLIERGAIDFEAPVARYWPEFAQGGKEKLTVRQLLGGFAGLVFADHAPTGGAYDFDTMAQALAQQVPEWEPGTVGAYHSMTAGHLFGELVRRVDGRMIDVFFEEEIAGPLGCDFHIGVDDSNFERIASLIPNPESATLNAIADPSTRLGRAWRILPQEPDVFNTAAFRRSVFPSLSGHGNARAVARVYAALANGGQLAGHHVLSPELIDEVRMPSWEGKCGLTEREFRYGLGFFISAHPLVPFGPNPRAFGHPGAGGAIGFCDPEARLAFSFSPNFMCSGAGVGDRCEAVIAAAIECA